MDELKTCSGWYSISPVFSPPFIEPLRMRWRSVDLVKPRFFLAQGGPESILLERFNPFELINRC
jgi:hypothetical protein